MKLTLLGTGTAGLRKKHHEAGYLIESDGKKILIDAGAGTMYRLLDIDVQLSEINHILFTHLHNDHVNDLPGILWSNNWSEGAEHRKNPLTLHGPNGFKDFMVTLTNDILKIKIEDFKYEILVKEVTNTSFSIGELQIKTTELDHHSDIGYRLEKNGKSIVITGDTAYCDQIRELIKDADIVVMECGRKDGEGHMTPELCAKAVKDSGVKKLILVHRYEELDNVDIKSIVQKDFDREVILGEDLMEFEL